MEAAVVAGARGVKGGEGWRGEGWMGEGWMGKGWISAGWREKGWPCWTNLVWAAVGGEVGAEGGGAFRGKFVCPEGVVSVDCVGQGGVGIRRDQP